MPKGKINFKTAVIHPCRRESVELVRLVGSIPKSFARLLVSVNESYWRRFSNELKHNFPVGLRFCHIRCGEVCSSFKLNANLKQNNIAVLAKVARFVRRHIKTENR